jgi:hypothetical protein
MEVGFRSSSAVVTGFRANTVVPAPDDIEDGDLLVLVFYIEEVETPPAPPGFVPFTNLGSLPFPVRDADLWVWRKRASNENGDYTITHADTFTNAVMLVYPGVDVGSPEDVAPSTNSGVASPANPNFVAHGVDVQTPGSRVIYVSAQFDFDVVDRLPPPGDNPVFTERYDSQTALVGLGWGLHVCDGPMLAAGPTGDKTVTDNAQGQDWVTTLITLRALPPTLVISITDEAVTAITVSDEAVTRVTVSDQAVTAYTVSDEIGG